MRLEPVAVECLVGTVVHSAPFTGPGPHRAGPFVVTVGEPATAGGPPLAWSIGVDGDEPVGLRLVRVVWALREVGGPLHLLRNGYHSWSPVDIARFGETADPSHRSGFDFYRDLHHADRFEAGPGELRSETVTTLDDGASTLLVGFLAGHDHDGTVRLRPDPDGGVEVLTEAVFGGAVLRGGEVRDLHPVQVTSGRPGPVLLGEWARAFGAAASARVAAPFQLGWCSWYHYFERVTEDDIGANLARAGEWPFDVFQVDDGYQAAIGDWLATNEAFPSGVEAIASTVADAGHVPGLWLAPFLAAPGSRLARERPELLAGSPDDNGPLVNMYNDIWGGFMHGLDTTRPETLDHLESVARTLVRMGFRYLKLDFTFGPKIHGRYRDESMTPAQRVRAGYEAVRRGAGEDTFLLACGCPLGSVVGLVDGMRIGPDVAPHWGLGPDADPADDYAWASPSTRGAWRSTALRAPLHRGLWLNDPDCVMLRTTATDLTADQVRTWAEAVGVSGGMAIVSDDLSLLGPPERALLDEVITLGRASDEAARAAHPPTTTDTTEAEPTTLQGGGTILIVNPETGTSTLQKT